MTLFSALCLCFSGVIISFAAGVYAKGLAGSDKDYVASLNRHYPSFILLFGIFAFCVCAIGVTSLAKAFHGSAVPFSEIWIATGGFVVWIVATYLGWRLSATERTGKVLVLSATFLGISWWATKEGELSSDALFLLVGFVIWAPVYLFVGSGAGSSKAAR